VITVKLSEALELHREEIRNIVLAHDMKNPKVFGSVLHGTDTEGSDLDILVDRGELTSLLDIIILERHLKELLGVESMYSYQVKILEK